MITRLIIGRVYGAAGGAEDREGNQEDDVSVALVDPHLHKKLEKRVWNTLRIVLQSHLATRNSGYKLHNTEQFSLHSLLLQPAAELPVTTPSSPLFEID